jgi:transcriptional regulator with XRE-family HTH domain
MWMATPGDRIKASRETRKWTQEELAQAAGISKGFLSDIENNKRNISSESALKIADALGLSLDYLLRGETGRTERERAPVQIPHELSVAAEQLRLTYSQTLTLLEAHEAVVARRSARLRQAPTVEEWKALHRAIQRVYPDAADTQE